MWRWMAALPIGLATASGAWAQATQAETSPPSGATPGSGLFISPSGQPFRSADGLGDWFAAADRDSDTLLTLAEFRADAEDMFRSLDTDADGSIDGFENQAYEREVAPEIGLLDQGGGAQGEPRRWRWGADRNGGRGRAGAARYALLNVPQPVRNADADLSGRVSWVEWGKAADRRFQTLDEDGDGVLTLAGLRAFDSRNGR